MLINKIKDLNLYPSHLYDKQKSYEIKRARDKETDKEREKKERERERESESFQEAFESKFISNRNQKK